MGLTDRVLVTSEKIGKRKKKDKNIVNKAIFFTVNRINEYKIIPTNVYKIEKDDKEKIIILKCKDKDIMLCCDIGKYDYSCLLLSIETIVKLSKLKDCPKEFSEIFTVDYEFIKMLVEQSSLNYEICK